ncbi:MAG: polyprenol monophosphomannose synthase [Actinomycetota bacterium]
MRAVRALVVIPTFNEAASIEEVLDRVLATSSDVAVLVVDDGSPDGTGDIVRRRIGGRLQSLYRDAKRGLGRAYIDGFSWGLERGFDRFLEMDADLSHDPGAIPALLEATERCDLAIGSRYVEGGAVEGWSTSRRILSQAGNLYVRLALGLPVKDSTSGFRCYRRSVLEAIGIETVRSEGYAFQIELTYRTWQLGLSIREVPITFRERSEGQSKMSRSIVTEAVVAVARWGIRDLTQGSRRRRRLG